LLPKRNRISSETEIKRVLKTRHYQFKTPLLYFSATEGQNNPRMLVICTKQLGNAVIRNRIRRIMSAWLLNNKHNIAKNIDMVIKPRSMSTNDRYTEQLASGLKELGLWQE
jgi:ribonuclease P protein component